MFMQASGASRREIAKARFLSSLKCESQNKNGGPFGPPLVMQYAYVIESLMPHPLV